MAGKKKTGENATMTTSLVDNDIVKSVRRSVHCEIGTSTARMSWVHLVMIREVGVSSSHLKKEVSNDGRHSPEVRRLPEGCTENCAN
jgi:hypothetical protein